MLVDCHGGRRRRYWCAARDSLVRAMEDHLRHLGRTGEQPLPVERVGTWEVSEMASIKLERLAGRDLGHGDVDVVIVPDLACKGFHINVSFLAVPEGLLQLECTRRSQG